MILLFFYLSSKYKFWVGAFSYYPEKLYQLLKNSIWKQKSIPFQLIRKIHYISSQLFNTSSSKPHPSSKTLACMPCFTTKHCYFRNHIVRIVVILSHSICISSQICSLCLQIDFSLIQSKIATLPGNCPGQQNDSVLPLSINLSLIRLNWSWNSTLRLIYTITCCAYYNIMMAEVFVSLIWTVFTVPGTSIPLHGSILGPMFLIIKPLVTGHIFQKGHFYFSLPYCS